MEHLGQQLQPTHQRAGQDQLAGGRDGIVARGAPPPHDSRWKLYALSPAAIQGSQPHHTWGVTFGCLDRIEAPLRAFEPGHHCG